MVWACIEKKRRMCGQKSDGDGGAGKRRGRPKRRWLDNIRNDLSEIELSGEEAQDPVKWRRLIRNIDPHKTGKRCGRRMHVPVPCSS